MNSFKEAYQDDLENAFFDEDEFAGRHTIDGEECTIILTECTSSIPYHRNIKSVFTQKETAINEISYIVFIRDTEAEKLNRKKFTSNAVINLDGNKYFVQDVKHTDGVYRLVIGIHGV